MADKIDIKDGEARKDSIRSPTLLCGYQGFGLVGALAVNHLIEQMDFREIGGSQLREVPPIITLKDGKILKPLSIFYNEENNIVAVIVVAPSMGIEWQIADIIKKLYDKMEAKEIVVAEGISSGTEDKAYYITNYGIAKEKIGAVKPLESSIISGVTSALLMTDAKVLCMLGNLPVSKDSRVTPANAAAEVIGNLNSYLGLKVGTEQLEKLGEDMESQMQQFIDMLDKEKRSQQNSYIG